LKSTRKIAFWETQEEKNNGKKGKKEIKRRTMKGYHERKEERVKEPEINNMIGKSK
jgi:hypothetical protein